MSLPDPDAPLAFVFRQDSHWLLERRTDSTWVSDGDVLEIGGISFELELPDLGLLDDESGTASAPFAGRFLIFHVSRAEEHVRLTVRLGDLSVPLGARAHNYPLLLLARERLQDSDAGIESSECGWIETQELAIRAGMDRKHLNLLLWRAIQAAKTRSVPIECLIERRPDAGHLRIGWAEIQILTA